jgi:hypothetical protein
MTRPSSYASIAASAILCAVLWPAPLFAQQTAATHPSPAAAAPRAATAQATTPPAPRAGRAVAQGFSVVLVVGDLQGAGGEDDVPVAARRALADMKDFLPYKSYKLVDAAWIVGTTHAVSRLRGPEDRDYELEITVTEPRAPRMNGAAQSSSGPAAGDGRVGVVFALRDAGAGSGNGAGSGSGSGSGSGGGSSNASPSTLAFVQRQLEEVQQQLHDARTKYASNHPEVVRLEKQVQGLEQNLIEQQRQVERRVVGQARNAARPVINTSFTMDVGETVVVGTSRLSGNSKALIALLTAVPQKSTRR